MEAMERVKSNGRRMPYSARDKEELIKRVKYLHEQGFSQVDIAKITGVNRGTLARWNKGNCFIEIRKPGDAGKLKSKIYHYDENIFENREDPNLAYIAGFLMGDGTMMDDGKRKRVKLELAASDAQIVVDIANYLKMEPLVKYRKRNSLNEQDKVSLIIHSTKICNDLIELYQILPRKTGNEVFPRLDHKHNQWAFLRGFFDADGCIRRYHRMYEMKSGPKAYLKGKFTLTGNEVILHQIKKFLESEGVTIPPRAIYPKEGCFSLDLASLPTLKLLAAKLYHSSTGNLSLKRKEEIFNKFN